MLSKGLNTFLQEQKKHMLKLDEVELAADDGFRERIFRTEGGLKTSVNELIYNNMIGWLNSPEAEHSLWREQQILEKRIAEDTLSTSAPTFTTAALPLVRRIYNKLDAVDLVSVQPLAGPSGYVFYLDKTYNTTTGEVTAGQRTDLQKPRNYANSSETGAIRELNMALTRKLIEAISVKLKADWTIEAEQDYKSQYKLDVENEMVTELADEVVRELNRKILFALIGGIGNTVTYNPTGYLGGDTASGDRVAYRTYGLYGALYDAQAWILENKVKDENDVDWWVVMRPTEWARFRKLANHDMSQISVEREAGIGKRYVGTIDGMFKVYVTNEMKKNQMLMGIKKGWKYAVGYYSPYIPLFVSEKYITNDDFTRFARGVMSRYAYGVLPETSVGSTNNGLVLIDVTSS